MFSYDGVTLREVREEDLEAMRQLRNDPSTRMNLTDDRIIDPESQRRWFASLSQRPDKKYWVAHDDAYPFLGIVRMDEIDLANHSIRIGCDIVSSLRGQGYGIKMMRAALNYGFNSLNMHRVWLAVLDYNHVARGLYKKLGFKEEGRYREAVYRNGRYHDYLIMSLLEDEYRRTQEVGQEVSEKDTPIPLLKVHMPQSVLEPLKQTLMSGYIGQGLRVEEFEKRLATWLDCENVLTVNSCTSAIHLALRLAGVGTGDEVISTPMTCTATNVPILERGGRIVWADIDPATGNIDPSDAKRKITPRTKAIVVVHWGGYPCDLDELNQIAQQFHVKLIEDAAHALGATYKGRKLGCHSDFVCFSFQAIKHLTTVDGGVLVCRSREDYRRGKLLRWYGIDRETQTKDLRCEADVKEYGYKFHMNDVCATIGIEQLNYIDQILARHRANAAFYDNNLAHLPGVRPLSYKKDRGSAYWLYTILVEDRDNFMEQMKKAGITVSQVHVRNDEHTMMRVFTSNLPGTDAFTKKQVSIPVGWWVTDAQRLYIADTITNINPKPRRSTL